MRSLLSVIFGIVLLCPVFVQKVKLEKVIDSTAVWSKGKIVLADMEQISGLLKYNKITGLLQCDDGSDLRSFTPDAVLSFHFYDTLQRKQRRFISYAFEDMKSRMDSLARAKGTESVKIHPRFFEVLMEFNSFAVLCSTGNLSVRTSNGSIGTYSVMFNMFNLAAAKQPSTTYSYLESIYIFDRDGKVMPLLIVFNREKDGMVFDQNLTMRMSKMTDIVIQRYTEPYFSQIDDYTHENKLSYDRKEDILKMFEYYRTLITR